MANAELETLRRQALQTWTEFEAYAAQWEGAPGAEEGAAVIREWVDRFCHAAQTALAWIAVDHCEESRALLQRVNAAQRAFDQADELEAIAAQKAAAIARIEELQQAQAELKRGSSQSEADTDPAPWEPPGPGRAV
jgi:hypothetical protein